MDRQLVVLDTIMQYSSFLETIHDLWERHALRDDQYHAWKEWTRARILGLVFDNPPSLAPTSCSLDGWRPLESG